MKKSFLVSRKIIVDTGDQYKPVTYTHLAGVEYTDEEVAENTIIPSVEFTQLLEEVDKAQRKAVLEEMGKSIIIIDEVKMKEVPPKERLLDRIKNRRK